MNRRIFSLLAGGSLAALKVGIAKAQAKPDPSLLTTTLTPLGSERVGNADGSIPSWTGGYTTLPAGYTSGDYIGELFPDERPVVVINAANMAKYADRLSEGLMAMMTKYGFSIKVYPTHRTAAAPQSVYDRIAANVGTATLGLGNGRFGFDNAFGGIPFPIPDSDPAIAGAQIIWNNNCQWRGFAEKTHYEAWSVSNGQLSMAYADLNQEEYPYYQAQSFADYNGMIYRQIVPYSAPPNLVGQQIMVYEFSNPFKNPQEAWELLNGQGRVRRAPEISFDTPSSQSNGIANYDEYYGFNGSLERYDWKCLGKKEMYIPYNNNALYGPSARESLTAHYIDPDLVRFELHRCWVVEATLHPGERNVDARRKFYVDEDTYAVTIGDMWDANNSLAKTTFVYNAVAPELPGVIYGNSTIHNLQTDDYVATAGVWGWKTRPGSKIYLDTWPSSIFDPDNMAASAQY